MKKLGKLTISSEKMMKNEELINLQGGYDNCYCDCYGYPGLSASNEEECYELCFDLTHYRGEWVCE